MYAPTTLALFCPKRASPPSHVLLQCLAPSSALSKPPNRRPTATNRPLVTHRQAVLGGELVLLGSQCWSLLKEPDFLAFWSPPGPGDAGDAGDGGDTVGGGGSGEGGVPPALQQLWVASQRLGDAVESCELWAQAAKASDREVAGGAVLCQGRPDVGACAALSWVPETPRCTRACACVCVDACAWVGPSYVVARGLAFLKHRLGLSCVTIGVAERLRPHR